MALRSAVVDDTRSAKRRLSTIAGMGGLGSSYDLGMAWWTRCNWQTCGLLECPVVSLCSVLAKKPHNISFVRRHLGCTTVY